MVFKAEVGAEKIYSDTIIFSVVNINTWTTTTQIRESSDNWFNGHHSLHLIEFFFTIDNGDQSFDKYLYNEGFTEYTTTFEGKTYSGKFAVDEPLVFCAEKTREGGNGRPYNISSLINLTLKNKQTTITYKNLKIKTNY